MLLKKISRKIRNLRNRHFFLIDLFICIVTPYLTLFLRLDGDVNLLVYGPGLVYSTLLFAVVKLTIFYFFELYKRYWKTASIDELARLVYIGINAILIQTFLFVILRSFKTLPFIDMPFSFPFIEGILAMILVSSVRFSVRLFERANERRISFDDFGEYVLIIGAGAAGAAIVQELQRNNNLGMTPIAFIDDDPDKLKMRIRGIPVIGNCNEISKIANKFKINKIIIAMPTASGKKIREIVEVANRNGISTMTVPGINELLSGKVNIATIRKIEVEDLLRRKPIHTDIKKVTNLLNEKVVLLTGAGGSIGSELCRQILKTNPNKLVLLGHGENSIFEIEQELKYIKENNFERKNINTIIISRIADIKDKERLRVIYNEFRPDIIFHAAAHKHVPLMESNPSEVITNNLLGTRNLIDCCVEYNVNNFILISSDKAVNSTNLMGVSKRIAEMIVLKAAKENNRNFKAVRFGNVLGSRGSVVRTFKKQLERGGPITITHPDIERYFMTIPEAVQLVLQASVLGKGGEIFVLDMGKPIKILDMAKDIIKLAGLEEGIDIDIKVTGLRPGEKMYEELFKDGEKYLKTEHEKIMFAQNSSEFIPNDLDVTLDFLIANSNSLTGLQIVETIMQIVPEFTHQSVAKKSKSYS